MTRLQWMTDIVLVLFIGWVAIAMWKWLKKRDGSVIGQTKPCCYTDCCDWKDDLSIPIVEEPEPEKGLAQVLQETYQYWEPTHKKWPHIAQAAEAWFLSHGWREPLQ